jgi:tellurite resistance protein
MAKKPPPVPTADPIAVLEAHAESVRKDLAVPQQSEVFRAAVEAGYLAALADGAVDDEEHEMMIKAIELLSEGAVIEWEADSLLEECAERAEKEGAGARAEAVGKALTALGQAEAGLFFAAVVAMASGGLDETEADVLQQVGNAAGLPAQKVKAIVKKAAAIGG